MPYKQCITDGSTIRVTASYPYYDDGTRHSGIDTVHTDLKAFAPYAGTVVRAWHWEGGIAGKNSWGNHIVVQFAENQYWLAAHFASQIWSEGDTIAQGNILVNRVQLVMLQVFTHIGNIGTAVIPQLTVKTLLQS